MSLSVGVDAASLAGVNRWFGELDKAQGGANRRALTKAGKKTASLSIKEISARVGVKQKLLRRRLKAFPAPRKFIGVGDSVRVWMGLRGSITPKDAPRILKRWRGVFQATMPSGHSGHFARRPNPLSRVKGWPSPSTHASPSPSGRPNPNRHSLSIDEVREVLDRKRMEPIIFRHARASLPVWAAEFRRLLEVDARRAARKT